MEKPSIYRFNQLAEILISKYERYLPTAFDESLSLLEKVNKVIAYLNQVGKVTNDIVLQWNDVMKWVMEDGLESSVNEKLDNMAIDGTLSSLINVEIFNDLNESINLAYNQPFNGHSYPIYISHGGLSYSAPINTIQAFEQAVQVGYKFFEADIRCTVDNVWMVFHDSNVDTMTDGVGAFDTLTYQQIKALNIDTFPIDYYGTKIPSLSEFLDFCAKRGVTPVLEIKTYINSDSFKNLLSLLEQKGFIDKCIVMSFDYNALSELRTLDSSVYIALLTNTGTQNEINLAKSLNTDYISVNKSAITDEFCKLAHSQKVKIGAWTVDDENEARNLTKKGVQIITTNSLPVRG